MLITKGFHALKSECDTDARLDENVSSILNWFDIAFENTLLTVPRRTPETHGADCFRLTPRPDTDFGAHSEEEAKLERSLIQRWPALSTQSLLQGRSRGFQSYQIPIFANRQAEDWGYVDLIGVSPDVLPQIWEIKRGGSKDSPFHLVLQMIAYGIAIRHLWNRGAFRKEWIRVQPSSSENEMIREIQLFGIAPSAYWTEARRKWLKTTRQKELFRGLTDRIAKAGFPVVFVELSATPIEASPFFEVNSVEEVHLL